jgi:hypothetical protein
MFKQNSKAPRAKVPEPREILHRKNALLNAPFCGDKFFTEKR